MFLLLAFSDFQYFINALLIVLFSVCFHEFCHAYVAYLNGDNTAKNQGYFTINPLIQMGTNSIITFLLIGICWGSCPVNRLNFKHNYSDSLVSAAGPFGNLLLVFIFLILNLTLNISGIHNNFLNNLSDFFYLATLYNIGLFIFNLLPIPPLDGFNILSNAIPILKNEEKKVSLLGTILLIIIVFLTPTMKIFWDKIELIYNYLYNFLNNFIG